MELVSVAPWRWPTDLSATNLILSLQQGLLRRAERLAVMELCGEEASLVIFSQLRVKDSGASGPTVLEIAVQAREAKLRSHPCKAEATQVLVPKQNSFP